MSAPDILLVDDDRAILDLGVTLLREAGFAPVPAISGDIAMILLAEGLPFELLITDVIMPGALDGYALARHALRLRPRLRIIYTTGFSTAASIRGRGAPFGDVLPKPWRSADFIAAVTRVMRPGSTARSPFVRSA